MLPIVADPARDKACHARDSGESDTARAQPGQAHTFMALTVKVAGVVPLLAGPVADR